MVFPGDAGEADGRREQLEGARTGKAQVRRQSRGQGQTQRFFQVWAFFSPLLRNESTFPCCALLGREIAPGFARNAHLMAQPVLVLRAGMTYIVTSANWQASHTHLSQGTPSFRLCRTETWILFGIPLHGQRLTHWQHIGLYPPSTAGPRAEWPLHGHAHGHALQRPVCFCRGSDRSCFKEKPCSQTTEDDPCCWGHKKSEAACCWWGAGGPAAAHSRPGPAEWSAELPGPQQRFWVQTWRKLGARPRSQPQKVATALTSRPSAVCFSGQRNRLQASREGKSRPPLSHSEPRDHKAQ